MRDEEVRGSSFEVLDKAGSYAQYSVCNLARLRP